MLRKRSDNQIEMARMLLHPECIQMSEELQRIDAILDDENFLLPFEKFRTTRGRPTVPVETFIRMMYLKRRYDLSYEELEEEVRKRIDWRIFCRIPLNERVPDSTTLIKLVKKYGEDSIKELNEALTKKAVKEKIISGRKMRVDMTVIKSNIRYPTDAGLIADCVRVITRTVEKIKQSGVALKTKFSNHKRKVKKAILSIGKFLKRRTEEAKEEVKRIIGSLASIGEEVVERASRVLRSARRGIESVKDEVIKRKVSSLVRVLKKEVELARKILLQTQEVLQSKEIVERIVSIFDLSARPIVTGKVKEPVEFGRKLLLGEVEKGFISRYEVFEENMNGAKVICPQVKAQEEVLGRVPLEVAADREFSSKENEEALGELGVKKIAIPVRGRKTKERKAWERQRWFKRLSRWRAGMEGRISLVKRQYGLGKSLSLGTEGTEEWVGFGIFAHNLWICAREYG